MFLPTDRTISLLYFIWAFEPACSFVSVSVSVCVKSNVPALSLSR